MILMRAKDDEESIMDSFVDNKKRTITNNWTSNLSKARVTRYSSDPATWAIVYSMQ